MFCRSLRWAFARHVASDAARLFRIHRSEALFVVRRAVLASGEEGGGGHWTRVLSDIEARVSYRPW